MCGGTTTTSTTSISTITSTANAVDCAIGFCCCPSPVFPYLTWLVWQTKSFVILHVIIFRVIRPHHMFALCALLWLHGKAWKCVNTHGFVHESILHYITRALLWAKPSYFSTIALNTPAQNEVLAPLFFWVSHREGSIGLTERKCG